MSNDKRERRREQTLDLLNAWTGIGVWPRLVFTLAIIAGTGYVLYHAVQLVGWLFVILT